MAAAGPVNPPALAGCPRLLPSALGGVLWFWNFVRLEDNGLTEVYSLLIGSRACRDLMQTLYINEEEGIIAAYPSNDIMFWVARSDVLADVQAKLICRKGYFRAILV
ncbi:hypothetical protein EKO27_g11620 [Xylaria grammica]|uniref:Uncharacterized protein n=1 Tax=Xylaria grammica TaxID=363999 RepID=A0A439CMU8_9PEZI|nr:hypothetical protein EKO27_g11620 [Xylaria grammica]